MKLDRDTVIESLGDDCYSNINGDADMTRADAAFAANTKRLNALSDAELLDEYFASDCWEEDYGMDGFSKSMVTGFDDKYGLSFAPNEVKAIILKDEEYSVDIFVQPLHPESGKIIGNDRGGWVEGFDNLEDMSSGTAEWTWCYDPGQIDKIKAELTRLGVSFVEREMDASNGYEFEEDEYVNSN